MQKSIIFATLIVFAVASWTPSNEHQHKQHPHEVHHSVVGHNPGVDHAAHGPRVGRGHNSGAARGHLESIHHGGGGSVYPTNKLRRVKNVHHNKRTDTNKGRNHLRRIKSREHGRH